MSRVPHFLDNRLTVGGEVVSRNLPGGKERPTLPPGRLMVLTSVGG
jgi:hypothetical protein